MHTTQQAKKLWCPMGRVGVMPQSGGPASCNDPTTDFRVNCQADQCSMWRWGTNGNHEHDCAVTDTPLTIQPPRAGYCGLAGKPPAI